MWVNELKKGKDVRIYGNVGMGMVSGAIYVKGPIEEPLGNVVEIVSDKPGYRKFRSITEILCKSP